MISWPNSARGLVGLLGLACAAQAGAAPVAARPAPAPAPAPAPPAAEPADDPDDGIQVETHRGTLDDADVQRVVGSAANAIDGCFQGNLGGLRYLGGRVALKLKVAESGRVKEAWIGESSLGSWPIERCLLGVGRGLTFSRPKGGEAELELPLDFPAGAPFDDQRSRVELPPRVLDLSECVGGAKGHPARSLQVTVYVGPGGAVTSVGFATPAGPWEDARVECAAKKAMAWKLSDPHGKVVKAQSWWPRP